MVSKTADRDDAVKTETLGSLRLRHHITNEIILIPTPSSDPNDPLNWSTAYRWYIAILVCLAMFFCNFLAAGPTVAIVDITISFEGPPGPTFPAHIAKVAYFFTSTALCQGMGNLIWMPLIIKYGRRPVYVSAFVIYTGTAIWCGAATSYSVELAGRIIMGFSAGAGECLAPLTIADIFFLHERGTVMAMYTAALSMGVGGGIVIAGLITISHTWRYIYWVATALIGALTILVILTFPETTYRRSPVKESHATHRDETDEKTIGEPQVEYSEAGDEVTPKKDSFIRSLRLFTGVYTEESLFKLFIRPCILLILPPALWATLVMSVTIGFLVAISSNFASAFATTYGFKPYQSGLCFISGLTGSAIGIFFGGYVSDKTADFFTRRNGGIREPEMRLPSIIIGGIAGPLALILYGVGIGNKLHWMVPTLGLGLLTFAIVQATNVTLVYTIDAYRPAAGEITVTQLGFKAAFGFLLSFYTNPWIQKSGYQAAFGAMAGISAAVMLFAIPFFFWGKRIRHATWNWPIMKSIVHWHADREVGE